MAPRRAATVRERSRMEQGIDHTAIKPYTKKKNALKKRQITDRV